MGVRLGLILKKGVNAIIVKKYGIILCLQENYLKTIIKFLKKSSLFKVASVLDIWGVDYPERKQRFEVNYKLVSYLNKVDIFLKISVLEKVGVCSLEEDFKSAGWLEREVWDMFGIFFYNNQDLRRILTDYGFEGFPLRKDFPLSGYREVRYDDSEKRVVSEKIEFMQEMRVFQMKSPWSNF